jgi:formylmethanofuran dehydrogenase subunit C
MVYEAGNITIDSSSDAKGGVHAKEGIIFVRGMAPRHKEIRNEYRGGGSTEILLYDDYAYGFRASGVWVYEIYSNASVPTS